MGKAIKLGAGHFAKFIYIGLDEKAKKILSVIFTGSGAGWATQGVALLEIID